MKFLKYLILSVLPLLHVEGSPQGNLIFSDDFEGRSELGNGYSKAFAKTADTWVLAKGVLTGKQTSPDHGSIIRRKLAFKDAEFEIDFRFRGGKRFYFVINNNAG
jgi:hypothetical protein